MGGRALDCESRGQCKLEAQDIAAAQVLQMLEGSEDPTVGPFAEAAWELFGPGGGGGGGAERELGLLGGALMAQWRRDAGVPAGS